MALISNERISSVVIAGVGGFGLEVYDYLSIEAQHGGPPIAGFIDDKPGACTPAGINAPFLGRIQDFRPSSGQVVVVAIGLVDGRRNVLSRLWTNGVLTPSFIARPANISPAAKIGKGVVVCPFSIVNRNTHLQDGVMLNLHCTIGHGASVGAFSVLSPYSVLNGDAAIGDRCFLGTRATIYPRTRIGNDCIVDSHTGVRFNAGDRMMISSRGTYMCISLAPRFRSEAKKL